jgi:hypothetical protein
MAIGRLAPERWLRDQGDDEAGQERARDADADRLQQGHRVLAGERQAREGARR